ncbi:MAG TPA: hypothetical protein VFA39_19780, partial [Steroidobacteraceae bacterium]|nr:hypothetical protein [Steroidobacteraceae bacterium]
MPNVACDEQLAGGAFCLHESTYLIADHTAPFRCAATRPAGRHPVDQAAGRQYGFRPFRNGFRALSVYGSERKPLERNGIVRTVHQYGKVMKTYLATSCAIFAALLGGSVVATAQDSHSDTAHAETYAKD